MTHFDAHLLAEWTGGSWEFGVPRAITGISSDTRTLDPGALYVAINGASFDGHDFVESAFEKGAAGAVVSRRGESARGPLLCVKDTGRALLDMAAGYRKSVPAEIVGVTGSAGKTTVKEMIADVLSALGPTARTRGNWNNEIGLPMSMLAMDSASRFGVFEAGMNHPGELRVLFETLAPGWGVVTSVGPVHLEYFDSVRSIALEKSELIACLPENGVAVLWNDDEWYGLLNAAAHCRIITVAMGGAADYLCRRYDARAGSMLVSEQGTGQSFSFRLPAPGLHVARNALLSIAVGRAHGIPWEAIGSAIERFKPQPMRWERSSMNGIEIINDSYNANPLSMAAALRAFSDCGSAGGKWLVLGGMLELGQASMEAHAQLGAVVAEGNWAGLVTVGRLGELIADGAQRGGFRKDRIFRCADHAGAAVVLDGAVVRGDSVLLKASRCERLERVLEEWKKSNYSA